MTSASLAPDLQAHLERARAERPTLTLDDRYIEWLAGIPPDMLAKLGELDAGAVALCWATGRGDREALRLFDELLTATVPVAVRKFRQDDSFADEVAQMVRVKLLVARDGKPPAITTYAFGGNLVGLIRVAAVRVAINLREGVKESEPVEALEQVAGEADPELRALKERYAREFHEAFASALATLSAQDRTLLRMSISVNASIDEIARLYGTHRATAARWLNVARDRLAAGTRQHLGERVGLSGEELTSLMRLLRTEASRMMATIPPGPDE